MPLFCHFVIATPSATGLDSERNQTQSGVFFLSDDFASTESLIT